MVHGTDRDEVEEKRAEIANLLGIPLLAEDSGDLSEIQKRVDLELSVLPQRVRAGSEEVFDDF